MKMKLDALQLKMIAIITMFIDHLTKAVLKTGIYLYRIPSTPWFIIYRVITTLMRISYPLFIFMQVEGFFHTSNKMKYLMRLLLFACISQPAYNMFLSANAEDIHTAWTLSSLFSFSPLNILFTLALSFICIWITDELLKISDKYYMYFIIAVITAILAYLSARLRFSYPYSGVIATELAYLARRRDNKCLEMILIALILGLKLLKDAHFTMRFQSFAQFWAILGLIPVMMYSGERGRKVNKWLFYIFYPAHLAFVAILAKMLWA